MKNKCLLIAALAVAMAGAGCASVPGKGDPRDPLESYNRTMYKINDTVDRAILKPVAQGYDFVVPGLVKTGISNFFSNLGEVVIVVNDLLQGKGTQAVSDTGRFLMNSTIGLGGLLDIATPAGLAKHNEDFGQTLGTWGVGPGPYLILPLLGSSTVRDTAALPIDGQFKYPSYVSDVPARNSAYAVDAVATRANLLGASNILGEAALDPYTFLRDAYLRRRLLLVYDGNPPKTKEDLEDEDPEAPAKTAPDKSVPEKPADDSARSPPGGTKPPQ